MGRGYHRWLIATSGRWNPEWRPPGSTPANLYWNLQTSRYWPPGNCLRDQLLLLRRENPNFVDRTITIIIILLLYINPPIISDSYLIHSLKYSGTSPKGPVDTLYFISNGTEELGLSVDYSSFVFVGFGKCSGQASVVKSGHNIWPPSDLSSESCSCTSVDSHCWNHSCSSCLWWSCVSRELVSKVNCIPTVPGLWEIVTLLLSEDMPASPAFRII